MRENWFIAIPIAPGSWFEAVPPVPAGIRRFDAFDLHLTVAFLGGVEESAARAAFRAIGFDEHPQDVTLGAVVPMGSPRRYTALSVLLEQGREAIEAAMGRARPIAFEVAGTAPDERPPKAHITIARPKRKATDAERADALAWASAIDLRAVTVRLDTIALYTWSEDRAATLFRVVDEAPLPKRP